MYDPDPCRTILSDHCVTLAVDNSYRVKIHGLLVALDRASLINHPYIHSRGVDVAHGVVGAVGVGALVWVALGQGVGGGEAAGQRVEHTGAVVVPAQPVLPLQRAVAMIQ